MSKELRVGMIGYGFMGRAHSNAYKRLNDFFPVEHRPVLKAVCARNPEKAKQFADNWGYERVESDWRKLVEAPDIDLIDIGSPNDTHFDIAIAAAKAGKMIACEKPLAMDVEASRRNGEGGRSGWCAEHGVVQLPACAVHRSGQAARGRRPDRQGLSLSRDVSAGLDHLARCAARWRRPCGVST